MYIRCIKVKHVQYDVKFGPGVTLTLYKMLILCFFSLGTLFWGVMGGVRILGTTRSQKLIIFQMAVETSNFRYCVMRIRKGIRKIRVLTL